jgi:hypothetical protein
MGKFSSNGPDWTDVEMLMRAIGTLHSGGVGLTLLPRGTGSTGGISVGASIMFDVLPGSSIPEGLTVTGDWPCADHSTFEGHCFFPLHQLDFEIGETYKQEILWK